MKKIIIAIPLLLFSLSCSDKLSELKVEKLVNECLSKEPSYGTVALTAGKLNLLTKDEMSIYDKLQSKGLLTIVEKPAKQSYSSGYRFVTLTNKAQPFVLNSYSRGDATIYTIKLYSKQVDLIGAIQEIPAMNVARVQVTYKKDNKTPFYDELENNKIEFVIKNITLKKTENKGWIYCN